MKRRNYTDPRTGFMSIMIFMLLTACFITVGLVWHVSDNRAREYQDLFANERLAHRQTAWRYICYVARDQPDFNPERCAAANGSWGGWKKYHNNTEEQL